MLMPGGGVADGVNGDMVILAPAYNVTVEDVQLIVERTARAIEGVLGVTETETETQENTERARL